MESSKESATKEICELEKVQELNLQEIEQTSGGLMNNPYYTSNAMVPGVSIF